MQGSTPTQGTTGTTTWGTEPETTGGSTHAPRPECVAFANVYCGCLGEFASDTCVEDMAETCDWAYDLAPEFYDCVTAAQCQGDWVSDCTP